MNIFENENGVSLCQVDRDYAVTDEVLLILEEIFEQEACKGLFGASKMDRQRIVDYLEWAKRKNTEGSNYLYFVQNNLGKIVGGMDIQKDNDREVSIGFWKDVNSDFSMTKLVQKLEEICRSLGCVKMNAYIEKTNTKAERLLDRTGFLEEGEVEGRTKQLVKYGKALS
ncbi:MAG TPA: GNAT family N-acetyltransferase [Spirochaetia bacterium]|nr:GNAT family N-acetyltransferase [Spirochaetia bacterium]